MVTTPQSHVEARRFFDEIAADYRRRSETCVRNVSSMSFRRRTNIVTRLMAQTPAGGAVLDYGMGPAVFCEAAVKMGLHYVGIDISEKMVEMAREKALPDSEFFVGDLDSLDRFRRRADTVLAIGLIDYLEEPGEGIRKLAACVKENGRLIVSFRNRRSLPTFLRNAARSAWRAIRRTRGRTSGTAFGSQVRENSFVPGRDLVPLLRSEGFDRFTIRYLDCAPVLFNLPLPKWAWELGLRIDETIARGALSFVCASGVLVGERRATAVSRSIE